MSRDDANAPTPEAAAYKQPGHRDEYIATIEAATLTLKLCTRPGCWHCLNESERIRTALDHLDQAQSF